MTEEEKMMLRRLIVKEDELEGLLMELDRIPSNADYGVEWIRKISLEAKVARISREIRELKEKLHDVEENV